MSLWDTDKNNDKRTKPVLNQHDHLQQRKANATTSVHPITDDTSSAAYVQAANGRILVNDGTNDRIMIGVLPDGTFGIAVSISGANVQDAF